MLPPSRRPTKHADFIDSLRSYFLSPHPRQLQSPYHHNFSTLSRELTPKQPRNSFLFRTLAGPPTATPWHIKAIVTGSLSTFINIGYKFGEASIEGSVIQQLQQANKTVRLP